MSTEQEVEAYLTRRVRAAGGEAYKWQSPSQRGVPDRIVMLPVGVLWFVELKAPGRKPSDLQEQIMRRIRELGYPTAVIDSKAGVDAFLREVDP